MSAAGGSAGSPGGLRGARWRGHAWRAIVAGALAAAATGCYSPELRDCTVACTAATDCAGGQTCGSDGLCAAPDVAGRCASVGSGGPIVDSGLGTGDASTGDAGTADAGMTTAMLHIVIDGKGSVLVDGKGTCSAQGNHGDCTFMVTSRVALTARAFADLGQMFISWTSPTCKDQPGICTFTPTAAMTMLNVKFDKLGGSGGGK